jgi:hypothetical protein
MAAIEVHHKVNTTAWGGKSVKLSVQGAAELAD